MKKIILTTLGLLCALGMTSVVSAAEATCVYYDSIGNEEYTIKIKGNNLTISTTKELNELTGDKYYAKNGDLRVSHFVDKDKYYCRENLYSYMREANDGSGWDIFIYATDKSEGHLILDKSKSSVINDEVVENPDIPDDEKEKTEDDKSGTTGEMGDGFFGNLSVIKCGDAEIPAPIPPITRIIVLFIKIAAPIVLIIMGMIDIVRAVTASDEKKMKDAQTKFVKRLIPAALIFLVVTIIQMLVGIIADNATESDALSRCIDCMISDESKCGTN